MSYFSSKLHPFLMAEFITSKFPENFEKTLGQKCLLNPGNISDIHRNLLNMMPKWSCGIEVQCIQNLSKNKSICGIWRLNNISLNEFRFGGRYTPYIIGDIGECPHFHMDINPSTLSTNFTALCNPFNYLIEFKSQTRLKSTENILKVDRFGESSTTSITMYNPTCGDRSFTLGYLKSATSRIRLGAEIYIELQKNRNISKSFLAIASSYQNDNFTVAATCSRQSFDLSYWHFINDNLQIGSSFVFNYPSKRSVGAVYYQFKSPDSCVRGMINSDWNIGMTYEKSLLLKCGTFIFGLSCLMCMPTGNFTTGLKIRLDPRMLNNS